MQLLRQCSVYAAPMELCWLLLGEEPPENRKYHWTLHSVWHKLCATWKEWTAIRMPLCIMRRSWVTILRWRSRNWASLLMWERCSGRMQIPSCSPMSIGMIIFSRIFPGRRNITWQCRAVATVSVTLSRWDICCKTACWNNWESLMIPITNISVSTIVQTWI